jgi:hypothetical protein
MGFAVLEFCARGFPPWSNPSLAGLPKLIFTHELYSGERFRLGKAVHALWLSMFGVTRDRPLLAPFQAWGYHECHEGCLAEWTSQSSVGVKVPSR